MVHNIVDMCLAALVTLRWRVLETGEHSFSAVLMHGRVPEWGMPKSRFIVLSAVQQALIKAEVARKFGVFGQWVCTLVTRYEQHREAGLESRWRATQTNKSQTPPGVSPRIVE